MELRPNGNRFKEYRKWERVRYAPYDYEKDGVLSRTISPVILNTTNPVLKTLLQYVETSLVFIMKYVDILKNFKNIHWKNR